MIVRSVESTDADSVLKLAKSFATSFVVEKESFLTSFNELLSSDNAFLAVAEEETTIVGYVLGFDHCTFYANGRVAWVEEIMVDPNYRRRGIGRLLMQKFEAWSKNRGARLVALATRRATDFYKAIGYQESAIYFRKLL